MFKTEVGEFKGSKTLSIFNDERRVLSFGVAKAKAILSVVEDIKKFVEQSDKSSIDFESLSEDQKKLVMEFIKG
jgi:hypothetical protein